MKKENGVLTEVKDRDIELLKSNPTEFWKDVTSIGEKAFASCYSLTSITIPEGVTSIGEYAFCGCKSLKSITIPEGVTSFGDWAFNNCKSLTSITIPDSVTSIGRYAFCYCDSLTSITIPEGVTSIGNDAFANCESLKSITIPDSVTSIGNWAFYNCKSLTSITIPEGVTSIGNDAFYNCYSLTSITIPDSVTTIGDDAFGWCYSLTSITIPEGVTTIGKNAFNCVKCPVTLKVNGKKHIIPNQFFKDLGYDTVKQMCKEGSFNSFNTLVEKIGADYEDENIMELYKLGKVLGLFEPISKKIKLNGKEVKVRDVAYTLMQNMLVKDKSLAFDQLHMKLSGLEDGAYCEQFLKFMSNKTNCGEMLQNVANLPPIVNWFRGRESLPAMSGSVQEPGDDPTIEENRYKVYRYSLGENGVYKDRWNSPTVQFIMEELAERKYTGVTSDKKHIAAALATATAYKDQRFYDKASEIEDERRSLVEKGVLSNHILKSPLKQDLVQALDIYRERTKKLSDEILENCSEAAKDNIDTANKLFTYEMLSKDSEEIYVMGFNTSCCARLFGAGGGAQRASILHPDVQPLIIRDSRGEMIAMSLIYVNREKGYAVANDVEVNSRYSGKDDIRREIYNKFIEGVDAFVTEYNKEDPTRTPITKVHCGRSPNWTAINDFIEENPKGKILEAVDFSKYQYNGKGTYSGDWQKGQWVIWSKEGKEHER